ncbi:MAG TPA: metallophosphoesterase, partial [Nakamurella sp.]
MTVLILLHVVPWSVLVLAPAWPARLFWVGTGPLVAAATLFPVAMVRGHGRRAQDGWAVAGDTWLGLVWMLFAWSVVGGLVDLALLVAGAGPAGRRWVAVAVLVVVVVLAAWGLVEARRVPRVRRTQIVLDRLDPALDGVTIALLADTHYGPIDRAGWSARLIAAVNRLDPDIVAHAGDLADGSVARRRPQVAPLGTVRASLARVYITGNHEYFARPSAQTGLGCGGGRGRPAAVRAHPRWPDLALPPAGPRRAGHPAWADPTRRTHPTLHHPGRRILGPAVPGRAQRDQPAGVAAQPAQRWLIIPVDRGLIPTPRRPHADQNEPHGHRPPARPATGRPLGALRHRGCARRA